MLGDVITTADLPDGIRVRVFRDGMIAFHLRDATPNFSESEKSGMGEAFLSWHGAEMLHRANSAFVQQDGAGALIARGRDRLPR